MPKIDTRDLRIYCVDVGSIPRKRFAWARVPEEAPPTHRRDAEALVTSLTNDLSCGRLVALGFEAPMFVPVPDNALDLGKARAFEEGRPWSAGAGVSALGTGLVQACWILREIHRRSDVQVRAFLDWSSFLSAGGGLCSATPLLKLLRQQTVPAGGTLCGRTDDIWPGPQLRSPPPLGGSRGRTTHARGL